MKPAVHYNGRGSGVARCREKRANIITASVDEVTCKRCLRMLRAVEVGEAGPATTPSRPAPRPIRVVDADDWIEVGKSLRDVDPKRYLELLEIAERIVLIHAEHRARLREWTHPVASSQRPTEAS